MRSYWIGLFRLANIERCAEQAVGEGIAGDFPEAGVCRGGATPFMRARQVAHGIEEPTRWVDVSSIRWRKGETA